MDNHMKGIGSRLENYASFYPDTKEGFAALAEAEDTMFQYAHEDMIFMYERIASLEALVRTLAKGTEAVRDLMAESGGVYGLHLNGDPSPWEELTEGGRFECWLIDYSTAEEALSHPIVSELTGEKEGGE